MKSQNVKDKFAAYVGLAQRANAVLYGEDIIGEKLKSVKLVLVSNEASEKYKERVLNKFCDKNTFVAEGLAQALHRDNVNAVGITNAELANAIIDVLR